MAKISDVEIMGNERNIVKNKIKLKRLAVNQKACPKEY
jgi:hypothetical protein